MSDLSTPPLSLVPLGDKERTRALGGGSLPSGNSSFGANGPGATLRTLSSFGKLERTTPMGRIPGGPFAWPTPPSAAFAAPVCQTEPEPCEIEGPNAKVTTCSLVSFDPDAGVVRVQIAGTQRPLDLRMSQFRRLTLSKPLTPMVLAAASAGKPRTEPPVTPLTQCNLRFRDGGEVQVTTLGQVDEMCGLFTFSPVGTRGEVLRSFYPRASLGGIALGQRIGQVLIEQQVATQVQIDQAATEQQRLRGRKLGDILLNRQVVTTEQLLEAIEQQSNMPMVRIGEALLTLGFVDELTLSEALSLQSADRSVPLGELLVRRGVVTRADLQIALARKMGYPMVDVNSFPVEFEALQRLSLALARRIPALPLLMRGGRLVVALEDPTARAAIDEIEFTAQCKVVPVLAHAGLIGPAVERLYNRHGHMCVQPSPELLNLNYGGEAESSNKLLANLEAQDNHGGRADEQLIEQSDNSLVRLINTMIVEAQSQGVSDIHVECSVGNEKLRLRFRHDGVLRLYLELPPGYRQAMVARLKIMCDLDISERRKPQDGKIVFSRFVQGSNLELRVATIPTTNNLEDVVLRLLSSARPVPLDDMGLAADTLALLKQVIQRPHGMVLCVGPTGSGKTTTLHAALGHINTPDRKIWTAEDPIEITQSGLRQVQVNPRIDWTFAKALRAFLRADPDVVMVGEIRDAETAQTAVEASLTGHLVMSTLHTNSAPETVTRLLDMGMDPFSFADSLLAVLAQRLVRRLCRHCVTAKPAEAEHVEVLLAHYINAFPDPAQRPTREALLADWLTRFGVEGALPRHFAPGCSHCANTGLSGRLGLHEMLVTNRELRRLIQTNAPADELQRVAMADGMRTLRQDGILKVLAGLTSFDEVRASSS